MVASSSRTCWKCRISGPTPDLLNQNLGKQNLKELYFNYKVIINNVFLCTVEFGNYQCRQRIYNNSSKFHTRDPTLFFQLQAPAIGLDTTIACNFFFLGKNTVDG